MREKILPTTAFDLRMKYLDREFKLDVERAWERHGKAMSLVDRSYVLSAELDEEKASAELMVPVETTDGVRWQRVEVRTNWNNYWTSCSGAHCDKAREALGAKEDGGLDSTLGRAVIYTALRRLEGSLEIGQWPEGVKKWLRAPLRIELLEVRDNGDVRFRIWYYKWLDTRPHQPYVDVVMGYKEYMQGFYGWLTKNEAEGIYAEHLEEISKMLDAEGLYVTLKKRGGRAVRIDFTGGFREELLRRVGYRPERAPSAEPVSVRHLGGMRFEVGGRVVEFGVQQRGVWQQPYAALQFGSEGEAAQFYRGLKATGIYAETVGREVRLDEESYWGLLIATGSEPEGYRRLYADADLRVYKRAEGGAAYYRFVFKHEGLWRAVEGRYDEGNRRVVLQHADREVLESLRAIFAERLRRMGVEGGVGEVGKSGRVYRLYVYRLALGAFES